jgi:hypothetical protein
MTATLPAQLQAAQDMLQTMAQQRNAALDHCVQLSAELGAAKRRITDLEGKDKLAPEKAPLRMATDAGRDV